MFDRRLARLQLVAAWASAACGIYALTDGDALGAVLLFTSGLVSLGMANFLDNRTQRISR